MIRVSGLTKSFDGQKVLEGIDLDVSSGEILVVLGGSGTGKSVLLKHMMGLLQPDTGSVEIDGTDIAKLREHELLKLRKNIGYLFQEGALYDFMTVYENLAFPLKEHTKMSQEAVREKIRHVLSVVDLDGVEDKYPAELSGGMKKRVGLARAIILDSRILLCDEPTSGLDPIRSRDISDLIKSVCRRLGCATVVTSHDISNSFRIADRLVLISEGRIVAGGTPGDLQQSSNQFVQEFIR